jgi:TRAP-type C4-dicarboxylate transport system substrate-binding protein
MSKKAILILLGLALALFMFQTTAFAKTLRFQCAYPKTAYAGGSTAYFAEQVAKLTNGKLKVKVFWPGQLVKTREAFEAVRQGMLDGYSGSLLYFAGKVPEVNCQWLPFNWANPAEARDVLVNQGYMKIMDQATSKHGVNYLGALSVATMGLMTKFPINKLEDLSGKKIRAVGMEAHIVKALGGAAVAIAGAEQYMALQRGTVDGTDYPWYTLEKYKFYEVLNNVSAPAFHTPGVIEIVINAKVMSGLPADQQEALKKAAMMAMDRSFKLTEKWDAEAVAAAKKYKIKITKLSDVELARFRAALKPLWEAQAKRSPFSAKLVEILKAHLASKGVKF